MRVPIRFAVVGASRGRSFIDVARQCADVVKLTTVCDPSEDRLTEWRAVDGIRCYIDFQQVLSDPAIDAVPANGHGGAAAWEALYKYAGEFEHPLWRAHGEEASAAGHGGGDFFVLREFTAAIIEGRPPLIDVYDAVTWSSLAPLSRESIACGNAPVTIPDYAASRGTISAIA